MSPYILNQQTVQEENAAGQIHSVSIVCPFVPSLGPLNHRFSSPISLHTLLGWHWIPDFHWKTDSVRKGLLDPSPATPSNPLSLHIIYAHSHGYLLCLSTHFPLPRPKLTLWPKLIPSQFFRTSLSPIPWARSPWVSGLRTCVAPTSFPLLRHFFSFITEVL